MVNTPSNRYAPLAARKSDLLRSSTDILKGIFLTPHHGHSVLQRTKGFQQKITSKFRNKVNSFSLFM